MPTEAWVAIGAIAVTINSMVSFATLMYARRTEINTNSLVAAGKADARAQGVREGRAEEKASRDT